MSKIKLSIIIPAYNAEPYIEHLITRLKPQITDEVEVLVIDDGSEFPYLPPYDWVKVTRKENGGVSSARNKGLDLAKVSISPSLMQTIWYRKTILTQSCTR